MKKLTKENMYNNDNSVPSHEALGAKGGTPLYLLIGAEKAEKAIKDLNEKNEALRSAGVVIFEDDDSMTIDADTAEEVLKNNPKLESLLGKFVMKLK